MEVLKKIFFSITFLCLANAQAQDIPYYYIKFKTGKLIHVQLVGVFGDSIARVKEYGVVTDIRLKEIETIDRTQTLEMKNDVRSLISRADLDSCSDFAIQTSIGIGTLGGRQTNCYYFGFNYMKSVGRSGRIGFNIGLNDFSRNDILIMPMTLDLRMHLETEKPKSPIIIGWNMGLGVNLKSTDPISDGGLTAALIFGKGIHLGNNSFINVFLSTKMMVASNSRHSGMTLEKTIASTWVGPELKLEYRP